MPIIAIQNIYKGSKSLKTAILCRFSCRARPILKRTQTGRNTGNMTENF